MKVHALVPRYASLLVALAFVLSSAAILLGDAGRDGDAVARASQGGSPPVARIGWLPDVVSNGTWWSLDASGSSDPDGILDIVNYTWQVVINNQTTYLFAKVEPFKFRSLGLYKIYLTVRDSEGYTDDAYWAVFSIKDSDDDGLPDWWEDKYWSEKIYGLDYQSAEGDPDGDGYSNEEEFEAMTDPTLKSSHPQSFWDEYGLIIVSIVVVAGVVTGISVPLLWKRSKEKEKKKIEYAIEIEKEISKDLDIEEVDGGRPKE